jgi:DNA-binding MarR family transcriptional regulator
VGETCQAAINGRRAVKTLAHWARLFQLSESELQILWHLRWAAGGGVDQTTLANRLAFSPAQVSACVEKLRSRGLISHREIAGDRRRRLWQPSDDGNDVLQKIVQAAGLLREAAA